ncbi:dolichyl-phosphate-mannose--protein mannosyltransferase [Falsarthrobacter nasiphocae]|uniref:Polyprenol-phosphate-mannose--protein mannosyltransferase n=1 Tax=Falsarthrobacter nasiphocae TaxID=189863 RepID=A0AAE3YGA5_9MICC|nr:phospholipid carrier-dependent glycosyltransferase [Falsarthrobacter nasiphocae]MDR6891619.1 dolichyl-phosphate-mannose--protein O-mannosyl transferase [Falsarthrobacter nasiphocae]
MKPLPRLSPLWAVVFALVTALAAALRLTGLNSPHALIFDETYYAKDAWALLSSGFERSWGPDADKQWLAGSTAGMGASGSYVVHPPLGKWLIALGLGAFGMEHAVGWRIAPAVVGTLTVPLLAFTARRLLRSNLWGAVAGFLLAVDGMHLVMSRAALLDIFLTFFLLLAFFFLVRDRDAADDAAFGSTSPRRPLVPVRGWRLLAGVSLGLALGVKWSALAFVAVFGLMTWLWDVARRRRAGGSRPVWNAVADAGTALWQTVVVAAPVYVATWAGWIATRGGYFRTWGEEHAHPAWLPDWAASLAHYHASAYTFHNELDADHPYEAQAVTWLFQGRPTSFFYEESAAGTAGCAAAKCSSAITDLGNPLIWWAGALSLIVVTAAWLLRRDGRAGAALAGVLAGLGPWFAFPSRTMFTFYSVSFEPWLILCLVYALALALSSARTPRSRAVVAWCIAGFVCVAAALSAWFWPIWTGQAIPYEQWRLRMWFDSWI